MIKLVLNSNGTNSLIRSHNSFKDLGFVDMSMIIKENIRQGTKIHLISDNPKPQPHRGEYYLLYMQEYSIVFLFYLDIKGTLRIVHSGDIENAVSAIYRYVSTDTDIVVLKSDSKRAYRVAKETNEGFKIIDAVYKNKSSQKISQVYMNFFEAINFAVACHKKDKYNTYSVISPKNTVMFMVKG